MVCFLWLSFFERFCRTCVFLRFGRALLTCRKRPLLHLHPIGEKDMLRYLKILRLVLYLIRGYDYYLDRLNALGLGFATLLFGAMFMVLVVALWMSAYIRQTFVRYLFALAMFGSAVFFEVYTRVTDSYLTYSQFVSLVYSEIGRALCRERVCQYV